MVSVCTNKKALVLLVDQSFSRTAQGPSGSGDHQPLGRKFTRCHPSLLFSQKLKLLCNQSHTGASHQAAQAGCWLGSLPPISLPLSLPSWFWSAHSPSSSPSQVTCKGQKRLECESDICIVLSYGDARSTGPALINLSPTTV